MAGGPTPGLAVALAELRASVAALKEEARSTAAQLIRHVDDCIDERKRDQDIRHASNDRIFGVITELRRDVDSKLGAIAAQMATAAVALERRISGLSAASTDRWGRWQNYLIGVLLAVVGFLLLRQLGWDQPANPGTGIPFGSLPSLPPDLIRGVAPVPQP